jgi:hypothetical protein
MTTIFPVAAVLIVLFRLIPIVFYFLGFLRAAPKGRGRTRTAIQLANKCTGIILYTVPTDLAEAVRKDILEDEHRRIETVLVGGSIALAAWTQLFVSSASSPADRLSGTTLSLLFTGAGVLLIVPLLFRTAGRLVTASYRGLATYVGFGAVALSLGSAIVDLRDGWYELVGPALAVALVVRELLECRVSMFVLGSYADFTSAVDKLAPRTAAPQAKDESRLSQ